MLLIVVLASAIIYTLSWLSTMEKQLTITTTSTMIMTQTIKSSTTMTETETKTITSIITTVSKTDFPFHKFDPHILTVGQLILNGRLLLTLSINDSVFTYGEIVSITATLTNLTPQNFTEVSLAEFQLPVYNSNDNNIWTTPISKWKDPGFRPAWTVDLSFKPFETIVIPYVSSYWNFTEIQIVEGVGRVYTGQLVPEGTYRIIWRPSIAIYSTPYQTESPTLSLEFTVKAPPLKLISSEDAVNIAAQSKGWSATELASYRVYSEFRYLNVSLKEDGEWLDIYRASPSNGDILWLQQSLLLETQDPVVNLRGHYWYVTVNTNPGTPRESEKYTCIFWIDAINATLKHSTSPPE